MTKRDLVKLLERKQEEAINTAATEYQAARGNAKDAVIKAIGFENVAAKMQEHIEKAFDIWKSFSEKALDTEGVSFRGGYINPSNRLYEYVGDAGTVFRYLSNNEIRVNTEAMRQAETAYKELTVNINRNYQNVIAVVQSFKTTKEAAAYLKELGFDLGELENPPAPVTALAVQINTSYLFINKNAA